MLGRRRYERVAFYCPLELAVLPSGPVAPSRSFDVSIGGVGITAGICLERGTSVRVRFFLPNGPNEQIHEDVIGRVAYCRADEDGNCLGIEFAEPIRESVQPALTKRLNEL